MFLVNFVVLKGGLWQLAIYLLYDDLASGQVQVVTASSAITACDPWKLEDFLEWKINKNICSKWKWMSFLFVVIFPNILLKMTYFFYRLGKNPTIKSLPKKMGDLFLEMAEAFESENRLFGFSCGPISFPTNPAQFWGDSPEMVVTSK